MKYFTKSGHRTFVAIVMTYLVAAKLNDCWHKVVPSFFIDFFDYVAVKSHVTLFAYVLSFIMLTLANLSV